MSRVKTGEPSGATSTWVACSFASLRKFFKLAMVSTLPSEKRSRRTSESDPPVVKTKYFRSGERFQFTKLPVTRSVHFWVLKSKVMNFVWDWLGGAS